MQVKIEIGNENEIKIDTNKDSKKTYTFNDIPEHIIQNDIFNYLNSSDLFYQARTVSTNWNEMIKNIWSTKIKEEMIDQVKSIDFIYEKEIFTKTYEFKLNYLINYKNLLTAYQNNSNIFSIMLNLIQFIQSQNQSQNQGQNEEGEIEGEEGQGQNIGLGNPQSNLQAQLQLQTQTPDQDVKKLMIMFFKFMNLHFTSEYIEENQIETLRNYLISEENFVYFKIKSLELMVIEGNYKDIGYLEEFKRNFLLLNKEHLENLSDFAKLIYSFLQGMIEYQILKVEVKTLKEKIEGLLVRLQETSKLWPKKKKFLEKAYKLIIFTRSSNPKVKHIITLFEKCKIRHPLIDYNDESIKLILELRQYLMDPNNQKQGLTSEEIDEKIFDNITNRRLLLTKKFMIIEKFSELYDKFIANKEEIINNDINNSNDSNDSNDNSNNHYILNHRFHIGGEYLNLKEFLWCLKLNSNSKEDNINEESILRTKRYLDKNFDYNTHIFYGIPRKILNKNKSKKGNEAETETENETDNVTVDENNEINFNDINNLIDNYYENINEDNEDNPNENKRKCRQFEYSFNNNNNYNNNNNNYNNDLIENENENEKINLEQKNKESFKQTENLIKILESKEDEVSRLKNEKDRLVLRKQKTEGVLEMMKKFISLKNNMLRNKNYYRAIVYLMAKLNNNNNYNSQNVSFNLADIINSSELDELINNENFENILLEFPVDERHLVNFQELDILIKEIEDDLLKQVSELFDENGNNDSDNFNNNNNSNENLNENLNENEN
jgi:hypothetical protein